VGPADCDYDPDYLGFRKVTGTDGMSTWCSTTPPYALGGNGLPADISSLGAGQTSGVAVSQDVWHRIYSSAAVGHAAVVSDPTLTFVDAQDISVERPLFDTAVFDRDAGLFVDRIDGYPSERGSFLFNWAASDYHDAEVAEARGVPLGSGSAWRVCFVWGRGSSRGMGRSGHGVASRGSFHRRCASIVWWRRRTMGASRWPWSGRWSWMSSTGRRGAWMGAFRIC
jgi:hypothetical protein